MNSRLVRTHRRDYVSVFEFRRHLNDYRPLMKERMEERRKKERREENSSGRSGYHKLLPLLMLVLMLMLTSP